MKILKSALNHSWIKQVITSTRQLTPYNKWILAFFIFLIALTVWNLLFLNTPSLVSIMSGYLNTLIISFLSVLIAAFLGWGFILLEVWLFQYSKRNWLNGVKTGIHVFRSTPQIIGMLFLFTLITLLVEKQWIQSSIILIVLISLVLSVFIFYEWYDLITSRIQYFRQKDFYSAMLINGISEFQIINRDILIKNSIPHFIQKSVQLMGTTLFLLCSIDFIVSVGLSGRINALNMPKTLGSLLANIDSKQDILAVGITFTNPLYITELLTTHLQGLTVALLIVVTLTVFHNIAAGITRYHKL